MMTAASASMSWRIIRIEESYCRGRDPKEVPRLGRRHGRYAARSEDAPQEDIRLTRPKITGTPMPFHRDAVSPRTVLNASFRSSRLTQPVEQDCGFAHTEVTGACIP